MVVCLEQGADLHMSQLMPLPLTVSCLSKIQIGFTFLVLAHPGSPRQRAVKRVCVSVWKWPAQGTGTVPTVSAHFRSLFSIIYLTVAQITRCCLAYDMNTRTTMEMHDTALSVAQIHNRSISGTAALCHSSTVSRNSAM